NLMDGLLVGTRPPEFDWNGDTDPRALNLDLGKRAKRIGPEYRIITDIRVRQVSVGVSLRLRFAAAARVDTQEAAERSTQVAGVEVGQPGLRIPFLLREQIRRRRGGGIGGV